MTYLGCIDDGVRNEYDSAALEKLENKLEGAIGERNWRDKYSKGHKKEVSQ